MKRAWGIWMGAVLVTLTAPGAWGGERSTLADGKSKESYLLGYEFGSNLKKQNVEIDAEVLLAAVREGMAGAESALSPEEAKQAALQLRKRLALVQNALKDEGRSKNREAGESFLAANKAKDGVVTLPSGLQYKVLKEGNGPHPGTSDRVMVNYRGRLVDGREFDSSYTRGEAAQMSFNGMIRGLSEALQLMKTGAKWEIYLPSRLGYGERRHGGIPPGSALIFEVELVSVIKGEQPAVIPAPGTAVESASLR